MRKNTITSSSNAQVKRVQQLNAKAKARREEQCFVAEGWKLFQETPEQLRDHVFVTESFEQEHLERLQNVAYDLVESSLFRRMCDTQTPQGILTIAKMPTYSFEELLGRDGEQPLLLVLEDVQDPGNVGTMIRTAEGAGVTGILMSSKTADPFQPKVIRSTMGSIFRVPFLRCEQLEEQLRLLKQRGVRAFAAHLQGKHTYANERYDGGTAFLIGNEGNGLSESVAELADVRIRIPMEGAVESLNAAVAAALLMYTAHAQRHPQDGK